MRYFFIILLLKNFICIAQDKDCLLRKNKEGKYGYTDSNDKIVIPFNFEDAGHFLYGAAIVKQNGKYGLIDNEGNYLIKPDYQRVKQLSPNISLAKKDQNKWDLWRTGKHIITTIISDTIPLPSKNQLLDFRNTPEKCIISVRGIEIVPVGSEMIYERGSSFLYKYKGYFGLSNSIERIIEPIYDTILILGDEMKPDGYALKEKDGWRVFNQVFVSEKFKSLKIITNWSYILQSDNKTQGIISQSDETISLDNNYKYYSTRSGLVLSKNKQNKYGLYDTHFQLIQKPTFDTLFFEPESNENQNLNINYIVSKRNGKYGIILDNGRELIPPKYSSKPRLLKSIYNRTLLETSANGMKGLLDIDHNKEIEPSYNSFSLFFPIKNTTNFNAYFLVKKEEKIGLLNFYTLEWAAPCIYQKIITPKDSISADSIFLIDNVGKKMPVINNTRAIPMTSTTRRIDPVKYKRVFGNWYTTERKDEFFFCGKFMKRYNFIDRTGDDQDFIVTYIGDKISNSDEKNFIGLFNNSQEKVILNTDFKYLMRVDNLIVGFLNNDKFKIMTLEGKTILDDLLYVGFTDEHLLVYCKKGKLIEKKPGKYAPFAYPWSILIPKGRYLKWESPIVKDKYAVWFNIKEGSWGLISSLNGNISTKLFGFISNFINKNAIALDFKTNKYGLINTKGETVSPFVNDLMSHLQNLPGFFITGINNNRFGYLGKSTTIPFNFIKASSFKDGIARVLSGKKKSILTQENNFLTDSVYDDIKILCNGFSAVCRKNKWGLLDPSGDRIVPCEYQEVWEESEGLIPVKSENQIGFFSRKGKFEINPSFRETDGFKNGYAIVKSENYFGLINKNGKFIIKPLYLEIKRTNDTSSFIIKENNTFFIFNIHNKKDSIIKYEHLSLTKNGLLSFRKDKTSGIMDTNEKVIFSGNYKNLQVLEFPFMKYKEKDTWYVCDTSGKKYNNSYDNIYHQSGNYAIGIKNAKSYMFLLPDKVIMSEMGIMQPTNMPGYFLHEHRDKYQLYDSLGNFCFYKPLENKPIKIRDNYFAVSKTTDRGDYYGFTNPFVEQHPIDYRFSDIKENSNDFNLCKIDHLLGIMDQKNNSILDKKFYSVRCLSKDVLELLFDTDITYFITSEKKFVTQNFDK